MPLLNSKRSELSFIFPLFIGAIIGITFLYYFSAGVISNKKFEEFALGKENTTSIEFENEIQVHCHDLENSHKCINGFKNSRTRDEVVLWLGNSQLHTINQIQPGDITAAHIMHKYVAPDSKYYLTFSQANANLQEHYLLFEYLAHQLPVTTLVLSIVFDDMRETGIRPSLIDAFKNHVVSTRLYNTGIGRKMISLQGNQNSTDNDMAALEDTFQEQSEKLLNTKLERFWKIWGERPSFRGDILTNLYLLRNWSFGITPSSVRKMIPGRYLFNLLALKEIVNSAGEQGIKVLLYIVPLRDDVKVPYDLDQYGEFKSEIQLIAKKSGVRFANFESLVPAELWGTKSATTFGSKPELDFMHFQAGGHQLLADAIYGELITLWSKDSKR